MSRRLQFRYTAWRINLLLHSFRGARSGAAQRLTESVDTDQPGVDPNDHVIFVVDEDVCTRCGLCVDRCPTGVIIMGKAGVAARDGDPHDRDNKHGYSYGMRF